MPVAVIQEWAGAGTDTTNYDEIGRRMGVEEDPPAGLLVHTGSPPVVHVYELHGFIRPEPGLVRR